MDQLTLFVYAQQQMEERAKAKSYSLVFIIGQQIIETIVDRKPYAMCKYNKNKLDHSLQYKGGALEIKPNYNS